MKLFPFAVAVAASFLHLGECGSVRGRSSAISKGNAHGRSVMAVGGFLPLDCNEDMEPCRPWTQVFGESKTQTDRIFVDCGECIVMDLGDSPLLLHGGLDVRGKLVFPDQYEIVVRTPMIAVQGELQILSTKLVDGHEAVRIVMTGGGDNSFVPIANNEGNCGGNPCSIGKKAIAVAGGKLDIKGLPDATPTWVKLHDVERRLSHDVPDESESNPYSPPLAAPGCVSSGLYFYVNFVNDCGDRDLFGASPGGKVVCTENALKVHDRTSAAHGVQLDMKYFRHCLIAEREYLLTLMVRLNKSGVSEGDSTGCLPDGTNCIVVQHGWMDSTFVRGRRVLWSERPSLGTRYGELLTIAVTVSFSAEDLAPSNVYQLIQVNGLEANVDIDIERMALFHPQSSMFPSSGELCNNLAPPTGDAEQESFGSPYPFFSTHPWILLTIQGDDQNPNNKYFRVRGRNDRPAADSGLAFDLETACLYVGAYLFFSADVRIASDSQAEVMEFKSVLRAEWGGEQSTYQLAECVVLEGNWQSCSGVFVVPSELLAADAVHIRLVGTSLLNFDVDNLSVTIQGGDPDTLIVSQDVLTSWGPGAEILITSHTTNFDDHQVRKIVEIEPHEDDRFARLFLNGTLPRPTTEIDSEDFAVEVALLSRNVVFEGGSDGNEMDGGHFWVLHTDQNQHIEGVEIKNFGVQGELARYPIHFHFCGDVDGSIVLKNTVRDSNQRAIVVHATDNLLVQENVVFNTRGHAFVLEDGFETGNRFIRNLGVYTRAVNDIIPNNGFNGIETDDFPATFWATNPSNHWIGNVAAGSEQAGFWFELKLRGTSAHLFESLDPRYESLGTFLDNVAHSNYDRGLRTYPNGYMPYETANLLGFRSYRNKKQGLFFHNTENIALRNGFFADNGAAVDLDRSENITVEQTTIIGRTELYRQLEVSQQAPSLCYNDELLGMELHTFVRKTTNNGAVLDVNFAGFDSSICQRVAHISLDNEIRIGTFDWFTTLQNVSFAGQPILVDFCPAAEAGIEDAYLTDLDGSFGAAFDGVARTIVSDSDVMMAFLHEDHCTQRPEGCYAYCDVCFRTIRFEVDPSGSENFELKVCSKESGSKCIQVSGGNDPTDSPTSSTNYRVFNVHLPAVDSFGYDAVFLSGEQPVWPHYVEQTYEDKLCPGSIDDSTVELGPPSLTMTSCQSLIRNGNVEAPDGLIWLSKFTGVLAMPDLGISGSTALGDTTRTSPRDSLVQLLDARCFHATVSRSYEIEAWVKLVDESNIAHVCNVKDNDCPEVRITSKTQIWPSIATVVPSAGGEGGEYQLLHGVFVVEETMTEDNLVEFVLMRNQVAFNMLVDNVAMNLLEEANDESSCSEIVRNGNFADGARFWSRSTASMEIVGGPTNYSLQVSDGDARGSLKPGCIAYEEYYELQIQYKIRAGGASFLCDPSNDPGSLCPTASILSYSDGSFTGAVEVAEAVESLDDEQEWGLVFGVFKANVDQGLADDLVLQIEGLDPSYNYVLNFATLQWLPKSCFENMLLVNSHFDMGTTGFHGVSSTISVVSQGFDDDNSAALLVSERERPGAGPRYTGNFFDTRCLAPSRTLEITAQIKLMEAGTGNPQLCDVSSERNFVDACPAVRLEIEDGLGSTVVNVLLRDYANEWDGNGWNELKSEVQLPPHAQWDGSVSSVFFHFRSFPSNFDMLLDNVIVRRTN